MSSSLLCHSGGEPGGLPGLVDCGWHGSQLRPGPALAASLHSLQLCVLVPACIQGLPVRLVQGPQNLSHCRAVGPVEAVLSDPCPEQASAQLTDICPLLIQCGRLGHGQQSDCRPQPAAGMASRVALAEPCFLPWCFEVESQHREVWSQRPCLSPSLVQLCLLNLRAPLSRLWSPYPVFEFTIGLCTIVS